MRFTGTVGGSSLICADPVGTAPPGTRWLKPSTAPSWPKQLHFIPLMTSNGPALPNSGIGCPPLPRPVSLCSVSSLSNNILKLGEKPRIVHKTSVWT